MATNPRFPNAQEGIAVGLPAPSHAYYNWFRTLNDAVNNGTLSVDEANAEIAALAARVAAMENGGSAADLLAAMHGTRGIDVFGDIASGVEIRGPDLTALRQSIPPGRDGEDGADSYVPGPRGPKGDPGNGLTVIVHEEHYEESWPVVPQASAASGSGITALTGDVTASGSGSVAATIANDAVTYAKIQNVSAASKLLGRGSAGGSGDVEEITVGTGLSMSGTTLSSTAVAQPINSGTSNPGSPSANDLFYRTDLGLLIYYDGTRWLTVAEYTLAYIVTDGAFPITASNTGICRWAVPGDYGIYLTRLICRTLHTTGSGTQYWTGLLNRYSLTNVAALISNVFTTIADTQNNWNNHDLAINAVLDATACELELRCTKVSTPSALYLPCSLLYRKIIT